MIYGICVGGRYYESVASVISNCYKKGNYGIKTGLESLLSVCSYR